MTDGCWIQTDEADDVAGSIRHAIRTIEALREDPQAWKWIALGLHAALQGACVCHLTTSAAPIGAVSKANAAEWITFFEESRSDPDVKRPKTHLMTLPKLLKAVRKPYSAGDRGNPVGIEISDAELCWLTRFHNEIRNQWVHFEPMGWSIEVSGIPQIAMITRRIIGDILGQGYAFRHKNDVWREELAASLLTLQLEALLE